MNQETLKQKRELQKIIDANIDEANEGCAKSRQAVVNAQSELDDIAQNEVAQLLFCKLFSL